MKNISNAKYIITIDRGNTKTSYALHELNNPVSRSINIDEATLYSEESFVIASNVSDSDDYGLNIDINISDYFKDKDFFGMKVHYSETLGIDRLVLSHLVWSYHKHEQLEKPIMIIDIGTFMTVDFVDQKSFLGGFIFPGPFTLMESYTKGAKLKNLPPELSTISTIPKNTDEAISYGGGLMIQSLIKELLQKYSTEAIYLTGGGAHFIKDMLPNDKTRENKMFLHRALFNLGKILLNDSKTRETLI